MTPLLCLWSGRLTGRLIRMAREQPAQFENISVVAEAILECPDD
jgi:hypothetical protein